MVMTPWFDQPIPMTEAAEIGTKKVITDHSTVGIVVTTDGTVTDLPREDYEEAEERVIRELQAIGKPFVVIVNSVEPESEYARTLAQEMSRRYEVKCLPVNCLTMTDAEMTALLQELLYEFPLQELDLYLPSWVEALSGNRLIESVFNGMIAAQCLHPTGEIEIQLL